MITVLVAAACVYVTGTTHNHHHPQSPVDSPCSANSTTIQVGSYEDQCSESDDKRKYKCDVCCKAFTRARSLQEHRLIHTGTLYH